MPKTYVALVSFSLHIKAKDRRTAKKHALDILHQMYLPEKYKVDSLHLEMRPK